MLLHRSALTLFTVINTVGFAAAADQTADLITGMSWMLLQPQTFPLQWAPPSQIPLVASPQWQRQQYS